MRRALIVLIAGAALAQTPSGPAGIPSGVHDPVQSPDAPVIALELQVEYFRTDGVLSRLRAQITAAQADYDAAVAALVKACGAKAQPTLTQDQKRLFCVAIAAPPAGKK